MFHVRLSHYALASDQASKSNVFSVHLLLLCCIDVEVEALHL